VFIQNAIVLWNYLYLPQLLANCSDEKERNEMVSMIKEGSMINWAHVNLHGEFDFKRQTANDTPFDTRKILSLQLVGA
jgi:Tn3 transposase DDE domain